MRGGAGVDARDHLRRAEWRKSTYSANGSTCVEVARNLPGIIAIRDSKNPQSPALIFAPAEWEAFTAATRSGEFDIR
jgi:Domain of unknown function (DUF397)